MVRVLSFVCVLIGSTAISWAQSNGPTRSNGDQFIARPSWATAERLRGRVDAATPITIQVHLPLRDLEAAKAELEAVSDPDSPLYGKYLTSDEFEAKYSPTVADVDALKGYLESEGFRVTYVPRNRQFISAIASAAIVERVFATHLAQYAMANGEMRRAPIEAATIPAAISGRVTAVRGLHTSTAKPMGPITARPTVPVTAFAATTAYCSNFLGEHFDTIDPTYGVGYPSPTPVHPCGLTPPRLRRAYGLADSVQSGNDGRGVKIAIVDAWLDPTLVSDAQAYAAQFDPAHPLRTSQISLVAAPSGGDPAVPVDFAWYYEQVFDVEAVHAIAPGANIVFVSAATNGVEDSIAALNLIVQDNLASIVSNSWSTDYELANDAGTALLDPILIQGGLKGIGMYFSTGDSGDNQCDTLNVCTINGAYPSPGTVEVYYPASSPYATAVGGTSLYLNKDGSRAYETGWESGESLPIPDANGSIQWIPSAPGLFIFGAGGGPSQLYAQPKYQRPVVPAALAGSPPMRVLPDVAMLADFDSGISYSITDPYTLAYTVYPNGGGTSLAVQIFAATVGLAEQRAGRRVGFGNPRFYKSRGSAFRDIAPTKSPQSVDHPGAWLDTEDPPALMVQRPDGTIVPHTLHSAVGFDTVTGLGVPKGEAFLEAISQNY